MTVDVKLLAVLGLPLSFVFALLQLGLWLRHRERRTHLHWAVVNLVAGIGSGLLVAREVLPLWVSTSLANTILVAAMFVQWGAMARFCGRSPAWRAFVIATLLFLAVFQSLWLIGGDLGLRVLLASVAALVLNVCIAFELLRAQQDEPLRMRAFLASVFALHGLFYLFRSATAVTLDASQDLLQATGIQNLTIIAAVIKLLAWNIGGVLMVGERLRKTGSLGTP